MYTYLADHKDLSSVDKFLEAVRRAASKNLSVFKPADSIVHKAPE